MKKLNLTRRSFVKVGGVFASLGLSGFSFSEEKQAINNAESSVVWVWLGGGPSQFETFHVPKESYVPDEYRPVNGSIKDPNTGMVFGLNWENLIKCADKLNVVDSFTHKDSSHRQATHWMQTGHYNPERAATADAKYPSHGSIISAIYGTNNPNNGVPTYINQGKIEGEGPAWLGNYFKAFNPSNKDNLSPRIDLERFMARKSLLGLIDTNTIPGEEAGSATEFGNQAYDVILGDAKLAFDIDKEPNKVRERYGASAIGDQLLLARRLVEYGSRFVTIHYGGWDMHSNISSAMANRVPPIDTALSAFVEEIWERGMNKNVLLVVTGEFGRTKLNANSGRDHWAAMTPMLMSGGNYSSGRIIGAAEKSYTPREEPYGPIDLATTLFDHFGIDKSIQRVDNSGRPRYLLEGSGKVIL